MPHNHGKKYSKILEYPINLNFLKTILPDHRMSCEMQLLSLLDLSFTVSLFFSNFNFIFYTTGKYLKITHKTCWHIYTRPPIGVTPTECLISCKMCSDKIFLKLGMSIICPDVPATDPILPKNSERNRVFLLQHCLRECRTSIFSGRDGLSPELTGDKSYAKIHHTLIRLKPAHSRLNTLL